MYHAPAKVKSILTICFILLMQLVHAQSSSIDSLKIELKKNSAKDTTRVGIFYLSQR